MIQLKIKSFRNLKNEKKNSMKYIENVEWIVNQKYNSIISISEKIISKIKKVLFKQNLKNDAHEWYFDFELKFKQ